METHGLELVMTDVSKTYRRGKTAVDGVTTRLGPGVLGLVGPNGAGKSSLMRMLATVTRPTSGRITWNGADIVRHPEELRRGLGYLPQDFGIYPNLSAREFLGYLAAAKGIARQSADERIEALLELVNLGDDVGRVPLGRLSGGMRQRVGIAQALLNDPSLLIMDEPTAGLDPEERVRIRNLLGELSADRIIILSTHIVSDIEAVADEIAVLTHGRLRLSGTVEELLSAAQDEVWEMTLPYDELAAVQARYTVTRSVRGPGGAHVRVLSHSAPAADAVPVVPDLEDAYLWLIGSGAAAHEGGRV